MGEHTPRRKASNASSASSGATIKPSSRQNSASNGGFFARFRSSSQSRPQDGEGGSDNEHGSNGHPLDQEAGPSDYYRRSPSPSTSSPSRNGRRSPSSVNGGDGDNEAFESSSPREMWANENEHHALWADSGDQTPDADESMEVDILEYQKRLQGVLSGGGGETPEGENSEDGDQVERMADESVDGVLEKVGIGEEEFGVPSPRSTPPSTPLQNPRQLSYIHPSISRLRSHGRAPSSVTPPRHIRSPSNFSLISETSAASAQASSSTPGIVFRPLRRMVASYGRPTTMDVNGVIAVGTEKGFTVIYSFSQEVRCVLSSLSSPVTCVSISPDSTFIGVGHSTGEIYLYDLASPGKAARQVRPVTMQQVMSGRKEGHLDSKILHIGFVGARHTSIVTGDEHGRAFWWSLGRIMGVESNDVIRMLGSYQKQSTLFAMAPLPIGPHGTDQYSLSALLTPSKLVIVGLKPAKTWYRKMRDVSHFNVGAAAWLGANRVSEGSDPVLAYSWGRTLHFLKVIASDQTPDFVLGQKWIAPSPITAMSWYDSNHLMIVCTDLVLLRVDTLQMIEKTPITAPLSMRIYRDKVFTLNGGVSVGNLLHWNDRVLARVHQGDFLGAIHLALAYYKGQAQGNTIGLPNDTDELQKVVSARIRDLIIASLQWAFSDDRMRDDTHFSADGRGVDLTTLFESLATSCIEACLAMGDQDFLFTEAYEHYENAGIQGIFLRLLEPYIFNGDFKETPPGVVKSLISLHSDAGEYDQAEAMIWHVDPQALDINQAITLCESHGLLDALVHVYTRALHDYVSPMEKLMGSDLIYPYIEHVLSGLAYPTGELLPEAQATPARAAVYGFIFSHLSEFNDTEALLHALDIAFEDPYLNDGEISRQSIINQLLATDSLDSILLYIFVARNLPKYPQFLFISPSTLHGIMTSLATDSDETNREDRQLATEYLLSAYTPHDSEAMYELFERAGFFRILRNAYWSEKKWAKLVNILVKDPIELFSTLDRVLPQTQAEGILGPVLPDLLKISLVDTALCIDRHSPSLHRKAVDSLSSIKQLSYLRTVLELPTLHLDMSLRHLYAIRLVEYESSSVLPYLDSRGGEFFDLSQLWSDFAEKNYHEGQIWALDRQGNTVSALGAVGDVLRTQGAALASDLDDCYAVETITSVAHLAIRLCREHSSGPKDKVEDMWFDVLHELTELVHDIGAIADQEQDKEKSSASVEAIRSLVGESLSALVSAPLSFPRLFKRLVDSSSKRSKAYKDFRGILTGMLESYRSEGEMLTMTVRLVEADLFVSVKEVTEKRQAGWSLASFICETCGGDLLDGQAVEVMGSGQGRHAKCQQGAGARGTRPVVV